MKNILLPLMTLFCVQIFAQVPASFNYQAVVRNGAGVPIQSGSVSFQFSILPSSNPNAVALYTETQTATTDITGLVSLKIGQGRVIVGTNLTNINWSTATGSKYIKVEIDPTGGTNYALSSISELLSVPYALLSQKSIEDNDKQTLTLNGTNLSISGGNGVTLPNAAATQNLTLNGTSLGITGGNSVNLPTPNLTLNGTTLGITGGNSVSLPSGGSNYSAGNGIGISLNTITNTKPTQWTTETNGINYVNGKVGIGRTADPYARLFVNGEMKAQNELLNEYARYSTYFWELIYNGGTKVIAQVYGDSLGVMGTNGLNGAYSRLYRLSNFGNNPYIALDNGTSVNNVPKIGIYIDPNGKGNIGINENGFRKAGFYYDAFTGWTAYASVKSFREQHPTQPDKEIWYACIEGREAAIYVRGTAKLENGRAKITFPEDFNLMALTEGMTAMTTPNSMDSKGLAVFNKTTTGFEVGELSGGTGNYSFDWEVKAVRKGYENFKIVRDKMKGDAVDEPKKRGEKRQ